MNKKVTVVGAGNVGATCARRIVENDIADVVLVDVVEGLAQGKALDLMQSSPIEKFRSKIIGSNSYELTANSDIIVITAGIARKPGMTRDDLQSTNGRIVKDIAEKTSKLSPRAVMIVVTNPLDIMAYLAFKVSGFDSKKVIGMAGVLDSARYRYFIAEALNTSPSTVEAMVLGGHGDSMVPLPSYSSVNGIPIDQLLTKDKINGINERTRNGGAEIVKYLKTGSAFYAPSSAVVEMAKSILFNENRILPCSVYLKGEYGLKDIYCGVPARLSSNGVSEIVNIKLSESEKKELENSAAEVKEGIEKLSVILSGRV